jgi:nicotinamide riboside kinase
LENQQLIPIKKIVIIGPESTGKSSLCQQLASHYSTQWVREFAREYLLANGTDYNFENLLTIAKGQVELEEREVNSLMQFLSSPASEKTYNKDYSLTSALPLFIDTDMYVLKVWCEFVFDKCHLWILDEVVKRQYDLYLLCNVDLPWVKDELREYPDLENRERLYRHYKDIMVNQHIPWVNINGNYDERLQKAISAVDEICTLKPSSFPKDIDHTNRD